MLKQSIGMTESDARQIAEMYLSRYNPTYWDGSGKVPSEVIFEICRVAVDSMYNGCTLEIQLCKIDCAPQRKNTAPRKMNSCQVVRVA